MYVIYTPKQTKTENGRTFESCDNGATWQDVTGQNFAMVMPQPVIKTDQFGKQWIDDTIEFRGCPRRYIEQGDVVRVMIPQGAVIKQLKPYTAGNQPTTTAAAQDYTPYLVGGAIVLFFLLSRK